MPTKKRSSRARSREKSRLRRRSFLVVDDDESFTGVVRHWAKGRGAKVEVARHGIEALERLREETYDVLIVDLKMPEMDGYELHVRLAVERPNLLRRAVFVTGDLVNPEAREFIDHSGCPCLQKPFEMDELEKVILRVLPEGS